MIKSYSQLGQDLQVIKKYGNQKKGFFVEVGAADGIKLSNTYLLELIGWQGICIEPMPDSYAKCLINRPKSKCYSDAVYSSDGLVFEFNIANSELLSGITQHIDRHKNSLIGGKKINVTTRTLTSILDSTSAPNFIEYLSLDTEGTEFEILKGIDFDKYKFGIIDIEHNFIEPRRTEMRNYLISKGYKYVGENKWDDRYES